MNAKQDILFSCPFPIQEYPTVLLAHGGGGRFMHQLIRENNRALSPVTAWLDEPNRGYNLVKICTWDRAGMFRNIAGSFSAAGLNILSAQIFTRTDGIALDTFFVVDARTGNLAGPEQREQFEAVLLRALTGETVDFPEPGFPTIPRMVRSVEFSSKS